MSNTDRIALEKKLRNLNSQLNCGSAFISTDKMEELIREINKIEDALEAMPS